MKNTLEEMQVALRVLSAVCARTPPDPHDVEELKRIAPEQAHAQVDELACTIITRAIQAGERLRERRAG